MNILTYIRTVTDSLSNASWSFYFGKLDEQTNAVNDLASPAVLLRAPLRGNDTLHDTLSVEKAYTITVDFMQVTPPEYTTTELEALFDLCESARVEFLVRLSQLKTNNNEQVFSISGISHTTETHKFAKNWAGVSMTFNVVLYPDNTICYD